jgi:hypothetical protein
MAFQIWKGTRGVGSLINVVIPVIDNAIKTTWVVPAINQNVLPPVFVFISCLWLPGDSDALFSSGSLSPPSIYSRAYAPFSSSAFLYYICTFLSSKRIVVLM